MSFTSRPVSLVAERAVRLLRERKQAAGSIDLVRELLATRSPDEATATRLLETAFGSDPRLGYVGGGWTILPGAGSVVSKDRPSAEPRESDRVFVLVHAEPRRRGEPFRLAGVSALRLRAGEVVAACGGNTTSPTRSPRLKRALLAALDDAVPVIHDPPGAVGALERWLGEPLPPAVSVRRLGQERLGLKALDDLGTLAGRLGLDWRDSDDPIEYAETIDRCLEALRRPGERLEDLVSGRASGATPIDWNRYAFDRAFLRNLPETPGTYRFHDADGNLLYVGKSKNLNRRIGSYFRERGAARSARIQLLLDSLRSIEFDALGSDLEAMLREAESIRRDAPAANVQRAIHERAGRAARLLSILILEPAESPAVLHAFLIRKGRLLARVAIGPRGGGLNRIRRILDDHFFSAPIGPTTVEGPDLDVEVVVRWLATNRDRVVAFDPTDLRTAQEVVERLRWFLHQGSPFTPDGSPIHTR